VSGAGKIVATGIALGLLVGFGAFAYLTDVEFPFLSKPRISPTTSAPSDGKPLFRCDSRTRCEEMRSCEEAMFFLKNCKPIELDKDKDGIPCEVQWCQK
jgi:hypothetical protein